MGYVYYGNYARFYEIARVEALRSLGVTYRELEDSGVMMPVLESFSKYIAPAHYDEYLTIRTMVKEKPFVRIAFEYEIENEAKKLIHLGRTLLVFVAMKTGKPCRMPRAMGELIDPYFDEG